MSKKKPEARCPACGNTEFVEQCHLYRRTLITMVPELTRGGPYTEHEGDKFSYRCSNCGATYLAYNAEHLYEKLKTVLSLSGKVRYTVDCARCTIDVCTVDGVQVEPELEHVWIAPHTNPKASVLKHIDSLFKTKREAREHLLKFLEQKMAYMDHVSKEHRKEVEDLKKEYKKVKRSMR